MDISTAALNARDLERELEWFARLLDLRFKQHFGDSDAVRDLLDLMLTMQGKAASGRKENDKPGQSVFELQPPDLTQSNTPPASGDIPASTRLSPSTCLSPSNYAQFVEHYQLSFCERVTLVLSLVPHVRPRLLDVFFTRNKTFDRRFTEFGGLLSGPEGDFIPTVETLIYLLADNDLRLRFQLLALFQPDHFFIQHRILRLSFAEGETVLKAPLRLADEFIAYFTFGSVKGPDFGARFPAQRIDTRLDWQDLVLHPSTQKQIDEIQTWIKHGATLMQEWGMSKKLRPGYRCLFYGPPGTGKTITACLLGKTAGREVYKIDLSLVVSKYIGETEKNLGRVFEQAQNKNWILFFDEADALFGKRTETKSSHDRYANQEVSYLLQRIETFDGIVILASNFRENLDQAFTRRFESMIYFPLPRPEERLRLWQQAIPPQARLDTSVDLQRIAREYELSGGAVMNVIRRVALTVLDEGQRAITWDDLVKSIKKEYAKDGKAA